MKNLSPLGVRNSSSEGKLVHTRQVNNCLLIPPALLPKRRLQWMRGTNKSQKICLGGRLCCAQYKDEESLNSILRKLLRKRKRLYTSVAAPARVTRSRGGAHENPWVGDDLGSSSARPLLPLLFRFLVLHWSVSLVFPNSS